MDEIASRYAALIEQIAGIYADDAVIHAQLRSLRVTREEWDDDRSGGHFSFEVSGPPHIDGCTTVDARGEDLDGAVIDIIIHPVGGMLNWGEWYRVPRSPEDLHQPIKRWPPPSVRANPLGKP